MLLPSGNPIKCHEQCCRKAPLYQVISVFFFAESRYLGQLWPPRRWAPLYYCLLQRCAKSCVSRPNLSDDINNVHGQSRPFEKARWNKEGPNPHGRDTPGHIPCECRASSYPGYRPPKTYLIIISGEVRCLKNS